MAAIMGSATTESQEFYGKAGSVASEAITSVRTVTAFGNQEYEVQRYSELTKQAMSAGIKKNFLSGLMLGMTMLVFFGSYGLALWYGATLIGKARNPATGDLYTAGDMLAVFFAVQNGAMSLGQAAPAIPALISGKGAALPLHQIIDEPSKIDSFSSSGTKPHIKGNLRFDNIHFAYPSRSSEKVFNGLSLTINAGMV
jgi:ABC-type multidrug transport system fused ATPase/permease subunit